MMRRGYVSIVEAFVVSAGSFLLLDLLWLGLVAQGLYDELLGPLKRPEVYWPAALLFYLMYVSVLVVYAVLGSRSIVAAFRRGAGLGFVAYATYELTNWAVIRDWPALLVPIDLVWGVILTALTAFMGRFVYDRRIELVR